MESQLAFPPAVVCKNVTRAMGFETNQSTAGSASKRRSIRVLVVNDHALIRDGLTFLIAGQPDMEVVAEAADGRGIE